MAHFWVRGQSDGAPWQSLPLTDDFRFPPGHSPTHTDGRVVRHASRRGEAWVLLAPRKESWWVNGWVLTTGIHVLRERDEIRTVDSGPAYFSAEDLARIQPFTAIEGEAKCPRCRQEIELGTPAVRCPRCRIWHHQSEPLRCWTYTSTCALCPQTTDLESGFRWSPQAPEEDGFVS